MKFLLIVLMALRFSLPVDKWLEMPKEEQRMSIMTAMLAYQQEDPDCKKIGLQFDVKDGLLIMEIFCKEEENDKSMRFLPREI